MIHIGNKVLSESEANIVANQGEFKECPIKGDLARGKGNALWAEDLCQECVDTSRRAIASGLPMQVELPLNRDTNTGFYLIDQAMIDGERKGEFAFWGKILVDGVWFYMVSKPVIPVAV